MGRGTDSQLPPEHFRQSHSFGLNTAFSQIHYPALDPEQQKTLTNLDIRAGSHRDWGSLTMRMSLVSRPGVSNDMTSTQDPDKDPGKMIAVYHAG